MSDWLPERLPEDSEAERALLATICTPGAERIAGEIAWRITEEHFVDPRHRVVFKALRAVLQADGEINTFSLKDALDTAGNLERVGGYPGLIEILNCEEVGRPGKLVDVLVRKYRLRKLIRLGALVVRQAAAEEEIPEVLVNSLQQEATEILQTGSSGKWMSAGTHIMERLQDQGWLTEDPSASAKTGFKVGFPSLDRALRRLAGNMVVIAARPKCGKTTGMVKSAFLMAKAGHDVAIATLEMTQDELGVVLVSHALQADQERMARGELSPDEWSRLVDLRPILDRIHVYAFDPGTPWPLIESCLRQAINQYGCTVGYLDYFSLVGKPAGEFFSEAAKSAELSKRMRALPKSTGIIFVVLVQINREIGDAGEPSPAHIRDSGQIEQDMACGIFLWRQETKDPGKLATGLRWEYFIKIDFNRFGPGYVRIAFDFDGAHAQMTENEKTTEPAAQVSTKSGKRGKDQPLQFV